MALSFPSRIGDQVPASYEAHENITKLLQADHRGGKDQVITRVSLEHLQRIRDLRPGYFDGVKTWAKSGVVYVAAGAATVGALGVAGYGIYKLVDYAYQTGWALHLAAATASIGWVSSELGFKPVNALTAFIAITVRDSANRAAKSYVKSDERSSEVREAEAKECHKEILHQLAAVYNDCAKELFERYEVAEKSGNLDKRLELRKMAVRLGDRLPTIEKLLKQIGFPTNEVETVLQRFKDKIRFVQNQTCKLEAKKGCEKINAELLAGWSKEAINEIAVPFSIKERVAAAKKCQYSTLDIWKGYAAAALDGAGALVASSVVLGALAAGVHGYQNGFSATLTKMGELANTQNWGMASDNLTKLGWTAGALGVAGTTTAVVVKKVEAHQKAIEENGDYVQSEFNASVKDLQTIYGGINTHLKTNRAMMSAFVERAPGIQREIQNLGIVAEPRVILGNLASF